MKPLILLISATTISLPSLSQKSTPFEPCCNIISIRASPFAPCCNIVMARDNGTGKVYSFKPTIAESSEMSVGNSIAIDKQAQNITAVNGSARTFAIIKANPFVPCCGVVSIKADPIVPCCNIVTAQVTGTNETFNISVPKNASNQFKVGQSLARADNYAFLTGADNAMYSYSIGGNETKTATVAGLTGKVHLDLPADVQCFIYIYNHGTNKEVAGTSKDRVFYLGAGDYDIKVSSVKMEEITVQKGTDTRILAGVLNVTSPTSWQLYDDSKKIRITGASKPEKIGLPVGNYQVKINGSFSPVIIKDGETISI